jgi:hypothetical protein
MSSLFRISTKTNADLKVLIYHGQNFLLSVLCLPLTQLHSSAGSNKPKKNNRPFGVQCNPHHIFGVCIVRSIARILLTLYPQRLSGLTSRRKRRREKRPNTRKSRTISSCLSRTTRVPTAQRIRRRIVRTLCLIGNSPSHLEFFQAVYCSKSM